MTAYVALLRKAKDSDFGVEFPDFPGCITAGRTLDEARRMAAEALQFHVEGMMADGAPIPEPATLDEIMADKQRADTVAVLVDLPMRRSRVVRVNVTVPEDVLEAIDRVTDNRSRFLSEAAREKLHLAE
jgi:predicted RNase H-like HicB family nuclease